jgi:hypothetical protein
MMLRSKKTRRHDSPGKHNDVFRVGFRVMVKNMLRVHRGPVDDEVREAREAI